MDQFKFCPGLHVVLWVVFFYHFAALDKKISPRKYFFMFHKDGKICVMMVDQTESFANFLSSFGKLRQLRQVWRSVD